MDAGLAQGIYDICPTHVGMNRTGSHPTHTRCNLPHARGDEPIVCTNVCFVTAICPTHVGMNRCMAKSAIAFTASAPRTWG